MELILIEYLLYSRPVPGARNVAFKKFIVDKK